MFAALLVITAIAEGAPSMDPLTLSFIVLIILALFKLLKFSNTWTY